MYKSRVNGGCFVSLNNRNACLCNSSILCNDQEEARWEENGDTTKKDCYGSTGPRGN